jgi:hypothetical protein
VLRVDNINRKRLLIIRMLQHHRVPLLPINNELTSKLDEFCSTKKIPNIIFHGPSGCGKKTIVLYFVSRIYNNNTKIIKENVLFINCSQGKGIKYIREELKIFAKYNILVSEQIPFKSIVMLNFDNLSIDAQSVMRRIIEIFINTRFFIIVENKYKLLNPIISRFCSIYIPEQISFNDNGNITYGDSDGVINMHKYQLNTNDEININDEKLMSNLFVALKGVHYQNIMSDLETLYENGISCLDLIRFIDKQNIIKIAQNKKTEIMMSFYILKKEYRCEKLLMFHILQQTLDAAAAAAATTTTTTTTTTIDN